MKKKNVLTWVGPISLRSHDQLNTAHFIVVTPFVTELVHLLQNWYMAFFNHCNYASSTPIGGSITFKNSSVD